MLSACFVLGVFTVSHAQVLTSDSFSYTGALTSNGWVAHSGAGAKTIMANGAYALLNQSSGSGEDVHLSFTAQATSDTTYAAFDFLVETANVSALTNGLYSFHLSDGGTSAFRARTGILAPSGSGDFRIGINSDNANLSAGAQTGGLNFETRYRVVVSWDATNGQSKLWINPTLESDPFITHTSGATSGLAVSAVNLRQSADYTGFQRFDNVIAGKSFGDVQPVPEPASLIALGLGAAALLRRKRRA